MKYSTGAVAIGLLAVAAAAAVCQAATSRQDIFANRKKQNYVDPIYAFDDVDVVTSSAVTAGNRAQEPAKIKESPKTTSAKPTVQVVSSFVAARKNLTSEASASRPPTQKRSSFDDLAVIVSKNASEKPRFEPPANILVKAAVSSSDANQYSLVGDYSPGARVAQKPIEEKHHWSGLENYYKKLRAQQPTVQEVYEIPPEPYPERRIDYQYPGTHRNPGPIIVVPPNRDYVVSTPISQSPYRFPYDQTYQPLSSGHSGYNPITGANPRPDISTTQFNDSQHTQTQIHLPTTDDRRGYPYPLVEVAPPPVMERRQVVVVGGREYYLDPVSDPQEAREIRRHEERIESQRQNFGPLYDDRRAREQYQEALYCHLRNKINPQRQQQQLRTDPSYGGAVAPNDALAENYPSGGEFPSHLGIYNGTPSEDNFLCAASWVDNGYALTTASCVDGVNLKQLQVRFGEWNLNKVPQNASAAAPSTNNASTRITFTSPVKEVTRYYRYNKNNIFEHNLALIQLEQPINFRLLPYVSPACQPYNSRIPIRRSKICWAPVRNITLSEYFDAEGEGETKEKKNVALIEMPVKMIPNDDPECIKQTRGEFVNHPDYICSGDYRTAPWRAKLNQTDYFGSGIYCDEGGFLSLTSMLHPIGKGTASSVGYLDLSYYKPWMQGVINSNSY